MFLLFLCLGVVAASSDNCKACIHGQCFKSHKITDPEFRLTGQMAFDWTSEILYFHLHGASNDKDYTYALHLGNDFRFEYIPTIEFSYARTVDQDKQDSYIGSTDQLFQVNPKTEFKHINNVFNKTVWHMQFKDKLYYVDFNRNGLHTYDQNQDVHESIEELSDYRIDEFVVDKNGDIFFLFDFSIYRLRKSNNEAKIFEDDINALLTDKNGSVYLIQPYYRNITVVEGDKTVEIGAFKDGIPLKAVLDKENNLIYYDADVESTFYLKPTDEMCQVVEHGGRKTVIKRNQKKILKR